MAIKIITLSRLETDLRKTLNECADSGETLIVELPGQRLLAIQPLDSQVEDELMDEPLTSNSGFQDLVAKSKASARKPFAASDKLRGSNASYRPNSGQHTVVFLRPDRSTRNQPSPKSSNSSRSTPRSKFSLTMEYRSLGRVPRR
jgi:hypothetical protein